MKETIEYRGQPSDDSNPPAPGRSGESPRTPTGRFMLASGDRPLEGYTIKRAIGRGGFGEVYYAVTDVGKEVALKLIMRNLDVERRGVMHCMNLKSPHLITIHDLRETDEGDSFVIMEYVAGPNLESVLRDYPNGMPMDQLLHWLRGLVDGVAYLHDHGIVHRDLKPANLFLEEGVVKIGDYGLSKAITQSREPGHSESVGTCHYMAPEIGTGKYHRPIDIYAMGVILYEMLTGHVPFDGESVHEVLMKHLTAQPDLRPLQPPFRAIVEKALAKDPNHRPQHAYDLLPPGEAPTAPELRFIPDSRPEHTQPTTAQAAPRPNPEPPTRIGPDEEPILYIGPDTMPPGTRPQRKANPWQRLARGIANPKPAAVPARSAPRVQRVAAAPVRRAPARPAPPPAPVPPELPTPRMRAAELTTSMLMAAAVAAVGTVLSVPFFDLFGGPHPQDPGQLALLYGVVLLGSWGVLGASKTWESHHACNGTRRLVMLALGLGLGQLLAASSGWAHVGIPTEVGSNKVASQITKVVSSRAGRDVALMVTLAAFYGLAFGANRFWSLASRDRVRRFRLVPLVVTGAIAALIGLPFDAPQPWGSLSLALIAMVVQLTSPWDRNAAAYALYQRKVGRPDRKRVA